MLFMIQGKKGEVNSSKIIDYTLVAILGIIGVVILFQALAALFPTLVSSGQTLNSSHFPLASLFASASSAGWYILAAFVIVAVVSMLNMKKK